MDFDFSPDTLMLRDLLRRFIQKEVRPLEMKYFNAGALTPEESARLRQAVEQMGLWGLTNPEKFGGGGLDTVSACLLEEELGGTFVPVEIGEAPPILFACQGDQVARFLEPALAGQRHAILAVREPGAVPPEAWQTRAAPDGDEIVLNGRKCIARCPGADDFFVAFARHPSGLTALLIEAQHAGLAVTTNGASLLELNDCRVGRDAVLGEPGRALALGTDAAPRAWIRTGARYVGLGRRLIAMATEHARDWVALGAPLSARRAVQGLLAETRVEIESARWLVYHAAWLADRGEPVRESAAQVRLATGLALQRAVDRVTMIYTGPGPSPEIEPRRLARSAVPTEVLEVALDHARAVVAAAMLADDSGR